MGTGIISRDPNINIMNISSKKLRNKRSHGKRINRNKRKLRRSSISVADLFTIFKNNGRHNLLCKLSNLPVLKLHDILNECNSISHASPRYEIAQIIIAYCYFKLFPKISKAENVKRHFIKIQFINKGIDLIDLASIFRNSTVTDAIPNYFENIEPPILCYSYKKPTRGIIFNYASVSTDPDIDTNCPDSCDCENSPYRYDPCGHIITGDLNIVNDRDLIKFLKKGPKYRIPSKINWIDCRDIIEKALKSYCKSWIRREKVKESYALDDFINKCMAIVDIRIKHHETNYICIDNQQPLTKIKTKLKELGKKFVFVPADKAANNVVIV